MPVREYKNPFASPEPEDAPAQEPVKVETHQETAPVAVEPEALAAPVQAVQAVAEPVHTEEQKAEINILPPAEAERPSVSWESHSSPISEERPTFRADRREDRADAPRSEGGESFQRQPRDPREARQPRDPRDARQPRDPREARQPRDPRFARQPRDPRDYEEAPQGTPQPSASPAAPASKGFFGWLKGLFGAKPAEVPAARPETHEGSGDGQRHRRRHRGGRGHGGGGPQGFRPEGGFPQGGERGEGRGGERQGSGNRRRRHRGGSGRDRGGNPRTEGHQGGGAI